MRLNNKTDKPIRPTEEQFLAFAKAVIEVERQGDQSPSAQPVRIASLADLKATAALRSVDHKPPSQAQGEDQRQGRSGHFCISD